jgi:hypothetical protein
MRPSASLGCRGQAPADAAAESCEGDGGPRVGPRSARPDDRATAQTAGGRRLLDHLVSPQQQRRWDSEGPATPWSVIPVTRV